MRRFSIWLRDNEGRIATALAVAAEIGAAVHNAVLKQPIELGSLGAGLAAILTASAALLAAPPAARAMLARQQRKLAERYDAK